MPEHKPVIAVTSDHAGFDLRTALLDSLQSFGSEVLDLGAKSTESVDYPDYAKPLAEAILSGKARYGIAICGTGIGISIALNRNKGIRAALCHDGFTAALARQHNNANVLCMGARTTGIETARDCIARFFTTPFEGGRHERRVSKLDC